MFTSGRCTKLAVVGMVVLLAGATAVWGQVEPISRDLDSALVEENWILVASLVEQPQSGVHRMLLGHAQLALNRNNESIRNFHGVAEALQLEEWRSWTEAFRRAHPAAAIGHYLHGDALARLGRCEDAIEVFNEGLRQVVAHAYLRHARGVCHSTRKRFDNAQDDLVSAIRANRDVADFHASLGSLWIQRKTGAPGARQRFDYALKLSPGNLPALYSRWLLNVVAGRFAEADADYDEALAHAGALAAEVGSRFTRVKETVEEVQSRHIDTALNTADPGMTISQTLDAYSRGSLAGATTAGVVAAMYDRFPEHRATIVKAISAPPGPGAGRAAVVLELARHEQLTGSLGRIEVRWNRLEARIDAASESMRTSVADSDRAAAGILQNMRRDLGFLKPGSRLFAVDSVAQRSTSWGLNALSWGLRWQEAALRDRAETTRFGATSRRVDALGAIGLEFAAEALRPAGLISRPGATALKIVPDLTGAVATQIGAGALTPDAAEKYGSGFAKLSGELFGVRAGTWAGVRTLVATGDLPRSLWAYRLAASTTSMVVQQVVAPRLEDAARPVFEAAGRFYALSVRPESRAQLHALQESARARGLPVPTARSAQQSDAYVQTLYSIKAAPRAAGTNPVLDVKPLLRDLPRSAIPAEGGIRTGSMPPLWPDGEWPAVPWYGLGYPLAERAAPLVPEK
jgi:tetratricopeptide (TPR) repeat protein